MSVDPGLQHAVDPQTFRRTMGLFATGVTAVCGRLPDGRPCGIAANSFASVSLEPPLVSFCIARSSSTWVDLQTADSFAISFLAADQAAVCRQLAQKGEDRFAGQRWTEAPSGAPVLESALGWVDCEPWARHPGGDHEIVLGRVTALAIGSDDAVPLLYFRSAFLDPPAGG